MSATVRPRAAGPLRLHWLRQARPGRPHVFLRLTIVAGAALAVACTRAAAADSVAALDVAVIAAALLGAGWPDTHAGLFFMALAGIDWFVAVDDTTTPWTIGVAIALVVVHTAMAAAGVAPPGAPWTRAMHRRWIRRVIGVAATSVPAWAAVVGIGRYEPTGSAALFAAALLLLAGTGLWMRHGDLGPRPPAG